MGQWEAESVPLETCIAAQPGHETKSEKRAAYSGRQLIAQ